jgi:DMSO/TMAO reductase YedYZ molybdopterin-dependent catalytic subunit
LRYIAGGILFVGIGAAWKWLGQKAATVKSETLDVFAQCNKMAPAPIPLPGSSPPKGGGYTGRFNVYKIDPQIPCATNADWKFTVTGLVDKPQSFRWEDFLKLPRVVQVSDFHCVEGWSVYSVTYEGVRLSDLLERVGVRPQAKYVKFYSAESVYTDALSLEQARLPDVMAAVLLDGQEFPSDLGGPVRLVVPQMFAYKAVKWLTGMELVDAPHKGYWEARGYPVDAWVKK